MTYEVNETSDFAKCNPKKSCTKTFTVQAPGDLTVNCPADKTIAACTSQSDLNSQFNAWLGQFSGGGGCSPAGNFTSQGGNPTRHTARNRLQLGWAHGRWSAENADRRTSF